MAQPQIPQAPQSDKQKGRNQSNGFNKYSTQPIQMPDLKNTTISG